MALPSFCRTTVTVKRPGTITVRGVVVPDPDNETVISINGASVQFRATDMTFDQRDGVTVRAVVYLPPGADVKAGDKLVYNDVEYKVDGAPLPVESPTGRVSHIKAQLVDWEG